MTEEVKEINNNDIYERLGRVEQAVDKLAKTVDAVVNKNRELDKDVINLVRMRSLDMQEYRELLKKAMERTVDVRIATDISRVLTILDGDETIDKEGMRGLVKKNTEDIEALVNLKNKVIWIALGASIASGGVVGLAFRALVDALSKLP